MTDATVQPPLTSRLDMKTTMSSPLDFSFLELKDIKALPNEEPRQPKSDKLKVTKTKQGHWRSQSLKLNNNAFAILDDLPATVECLLGSTALLTSLDLSCNALTKIDSVILQLSNLKILQLHGNSIQGIEEVEKLGSLTQMKKITLHGNPMEKEPQYFFYVLAILPGLISLDFTGVTKGDREKASVMQTMIFGNLRGKKKRRADN